MRIISILFPVIFVSAMLLGCKDNSIAPVPEKIIEKQVQYRYDFYYQTYLSTLDTGYIVMADGLVWNRDTVDIVGLRPILSLYESYKDVVYNKPLVVIEGKIGLPDSVYFDVGNMKMRDTLRVGQEFSHYTVSSIVKPKTGQLYYTFGWRFHNGIYLSKKEETGIRIL